MRERLVAAAMELFGRQGFKRTTVAQIEQAAGISVGSGGMYRHVRSKRELLEAGLQRQAENGAQLISFIAEPQSLTTLPLPDRLLAVARAGLRRLDEERDVNRLLLHDLADFPDLLEAFRRNELATVFDALTGWLRTQASDTDVDVEAMAAVLIEAVSHYWVLTDVFGGHPFDVTEDRYLRTLARMTASALSPAPTD
ncbi:MAG: TetR/AcrR family transcriptional regulator [Trebonia sp.]